MPFVHEACQVKGDVLPTGPRMIEIMVRRIALQYAMSRSAPFDRLRALVALASSRRAGSGGLEHGAKIAETTDPEPSVANLIHCGDQFRQVDRVARRTCVSAQPCVIGRRGVK